LRRTRAAFDRAAEAGALGDLANQDEVFIALAEHDVIFPVVHRIIGDVIQLRSIRGERIASGDDGCGWRNDMAGVLGVDHSKSTLTTQVVICLDDPDDGSRLSVVPGSHRFRPEVQLPQVEAIGEMPHQVPISALAGSAVVLHGNIWQARTAYGSNVSRFVRYTFNHCWMRQDLPDLLPEARKTISASHNLCQLFGVDRGVSTPGRYWDRQVEGYPMSEGLPDRAFSELTVVGKSVDSNKRRKR
jgi:hypothetical protein